MKKYLLAIGLVLALVLAVPVATRAESLNVAQLRAIIASLQAQLNVLIAKLQLQIQQQNPATPAACIPENGIRGAGSEVNNCCPGLERELLSQSGTIYKCVKPSTTSQPSITITSPNGGEIFNVGDTIKIKWSAIVPNNSSIALSVINSNGLMPAGGFISILVPNSGSFDWTIPKSVLGAAFVSGNYKLQARIVGSDGSGDLANDLSDNYFTITSATSSNKPPVISALWTDDQLVINKNINWGVSFYDQDAGDVLSYKLSCGDGNNGQLVYGEAHLYFVCNYKVAGIYRVVATVSDKGGLYGTKETSVKISDTSDTPSLKATLNVTALDGAIQCFRAPCEFPLSGAQVTVYNSNMVLVGSKVVESDGLANFVNLNPGTYTVYVKASGYANTNGQTVGLVSGQASSVKIPVFLAR